MLNNHQCECEMARQICTKYMQIYVQCLRTDGPVTSFPSINPLLLITPMGMD